jgi:NADH-quinone oxidoreductase subunit G
MKSTEHPLVIIGQAALASTGRCRRSRACRQGCDGYGCREARSGWNGFNVLHTAAARVAGLDLGLVPGEGGRDVDAILDGVEKGEIEVVYLLGADEIDMSRLGRPSSSIRAATATAAPTAPMSSFRAPPIPKRIAIYVNTEGRPQMTAAPSSRRGTRARTGNRPGAVGGLRPGFAVQLRRRTARQALRRLSASCAARPVTPADSAAIERLAARESGKTSRDRFGEAITDFYLTNPIARGVGDHGELERDAMAGAEGATGTDG